MTLGKQSNTAGDSNPADGNYLNGLDNRKWMENTSRTAGPLRKIS